MAALLRGAALLTGLATYPIFSYNIANITKPWAARPDTT